MVCQGLSSGGKNISETTALRKYKPMLRCICPREKSAEAVGKYTPNQLIGAWLSELREDKQAIDGTVAWFKKIRAQI